MRSVFCILGLGISFSILAAESLPFSPLPKKAPAPKDNPTTEAKVNLGRQLYFDPRVSIDGTVSCNSCHNVMSGGTDNRRVSVGVGGQKGGRNSPTVFNAAFLSVQFWDGRAKTLEEQAAGPMINAVEMGAANHDIVVGRIQDIPGYVTQFTKVFGKDQVNIDTATKAIAAYERTLITPNAPFDKYLRGNKKALDANAQRGLKLVNELGCVACHNGVAFAGPMDPLSGAGFYQKFPTFADNEYVKKYRLDEDKGRFEATKDEKDKGLFRVPTWRNIALTAPYFHNGMVPTLDEAVRVMAKVQLNKELSNEQVSDIVAFLNSLTGELPKQAMPSLPLTPNRTLVMD